MVLLHRALLHHLRHHPPHPHPNQPLRLPNIHPLPLHAATATPTRIRLPGFGPPRQRHQHLHVGQLRQLARRDAEHAFRLRLLHRLHHDLPRWHLPPLARKGRGPQRVGLENILHCAGYRVSGDDTGDDCGDGEPLLDGCAGGERGGVPGIFVQWRLFGAVTVGGFAAVGVEGG